MAHVSEKVREMLEDGKTGDEIMSSFREYFEKARGTPEEVSTLRELGFAAREIASQVARRGHELGE